MFRGIRFLCGVLAVASAMLLIGSATHADLVHQYSFTTDASDSVGTAHATPYGGTPPWEPALTFENGQAVLGNDGETYRSDDNGTSPPADPPGAYLDLPNGTISAIGNQATFETWFTWNGGGLYQRLFDFGTADAGENNSSGGANNRQIMLVPKANYSRLSFYTHDSNDAYNVVYTDTVMAIGTEYHIAVAWDGANDYATVYVNGRPSGCMPGLAFSLEDLVDDNNWLGRSQWNDLLLAGSFNEFRIYNETLSAAQLYKNSLDGADAAFTRVTPVTTPTTLTALPIHRYSFEGNCNDSIGTAHGTLVNNTTNSMYDDHKLTLGNDGTQRSGDLSGDTSGDYVDLPNGMISSLTDNATFEFWVTSDSDPSTIWERIFDFGTSVSGEDISDGGSGCSSILGIARSSEQLLRFGHREAVSNELRYASGPTSITPGAETHVVCVWDGDNDQISLYLDGEFMSTNETLLDLSDLVDVNNWLGRAQYNDLMFEGSYNEFRIYDYALSAEEILGNYQVGPDELNIDRIPGDADGDGNVDHDDAQALATNWGITTDATWAMGDFNRDGAVDMKDASILAANWGTTSETAAVPEPSALLMILGGLIALAGCRRAR